MELVTCHTHTVYSGHGHGTVEELVAAAVEVGVTTLAITEHYPLSDAMDPTHTVSLSQDEEPRYLCEIEAQRALSLPIDLVCGCEVDWLGAQEDRVFTQESWAPYAWILGSVHYLDGWAFDDPALVDTWQEHGSVNDIWNRYFEVWCEAASSSMPFHAMSHPDLVKKFGFYPTCDMSANYNRAVEAVKSADRMIEVNASGLYCPCKQAYPSQELLSLFCKAGVECSVGSDAHTPENVVRGIEDAYRLMREAGYRFVTVPTADGDRRRIPLE